MPEKPTYLGMLNAISVAEGRAHQYLSAWADVTPDPEVRALLRLIATREGEHSLSFAKRIQELGFDVIEPEEPRPLKELEVVRSARSDLEKMEAVGLLDYDVPDGPDVFDNLFKDHSIDIQTGALLGRYIAEERDTLRRFRGCYNQLKSLVAAP
jgi:rubrerythrin